VIRPSRYLGQKWRRAKSGRHGRFNDGASPEWSEPWLGAHTCRLSTEREARPARAAPSPQALPRRPSALRRSLQPRRRERAAPAREAAGWRGPPWHAGPPGTIFFPGRVGRRIARPEPITDPPCLQKAPDGSGCFWHIALTPPSVQKEAEAVVAGSGPWPSTCSGPAAMSAQPRAASSDQTNVKDSSRDPSCASQRARAWRSAPVERHPTVT
jgi:hypothetical protein